MRLTVSCPETLRDDANHLAMVLAEGPEDGGTYGALRWQDADGALYAAASFVARPEWIAAATAPLARPDWDQGPPYIVNMTGAGRAQAALDVWLGEGQIPQARPGAITVVAGDDALASMAAMGLALLPVPEPDDAP
jgi:hypothetical protein